MLLRPLSAIFHLFSLFSLLLATAQSPADGYSLNTTIAVGDGMLAMMPTMARTHAEYSTSIVDTGGSYVCPGI